MAEKSLFFNSEDEDIREYSAADMAEVLSGICPTGIIEGLNVSGTGTGAIRVSPGKAIINGYIYCLFDEKVFSIEPSDIDRINRMVLRLDLSARSLTLSLKSGTDQAKPVLERNQTIYEISLAFISISAGSRVVSSIKSDAIYSRNYTKLESEINELYLKHYNDIKNLKASLNNLIVNGNETYGNSELIDIRTGADGTIYNTAGMAVREQIGELTRDMSNLLAESKNMINSEAITNGAYVNRYGEVKSNDALCVTEYIKLSADQNYTLSTGQTGSFAYVTMFDADKSVISHNTIAAADFYAGFTFTADTKGYVRISCPIEASSNSFQLEKGSEKTVFEDYGKAFIGDISNQLGEKDVLDFGNVEPEATSFARIGNQLINPANVEYGYRYSYISGTKTEDNTYATVRIHAYPGTAYTLSGCVAFICFWDYRQRFISGEVNSDASVSCTFETPSGTRYITVSVPISTLNKTAMLNYGNTAIDFEDYYIEFEGLRIPDLYRMIVDDSAKNQVSVWSSKKVSDTISSFHNYDLYNFPYIKNGRVCCNKASETRTAYYAGVDCGKTVDYIGAKWIWEEGTESGALALIINPNGLQKVTDITDLSLHLVITASKIKLDILGDKFGQTYYKTLINEDITAMSLDGETVHTVTMTVNKTNNSCTVNLDGSDYTGSFSPDANVPGITTAIGPYATFEHYCEGDRDSKAMPMFTQFVAKSGNNYLVYDNFERQDGQLSTTPQGHVYNLISTANYYSNTEPVMNQYMRHSDFQVVTQAQYDAMTSHDANVFYVIVG